MNRRPPESTCPGDFLDALDRAEPLALLPDWDDEGTPGWLWFRRPQRVLQTRRLDHVRPLIAELEAAVEAGAWAVGFLTYEAAPAFDSDLAAHEPGPLPLTWWGLYSAPAGSWRGELPSRLDDLRPIPWKPALGREPYVRSIAEIHQSIAAGDTYQVNFTFPLEAPFTGSPYTLFSRLWQAQRSPLGGYLDLGRFCICSASPELFFERSGERLVTRPMKGTARRGRFAEEDRESRTSLQASEKDRAENVMIVDMMRNDLGRIAIPGSVRVEDLCTVETYPTVFQLTSTVAARSRASLEEVLGALFPCASITGAPKISTSHIIHRLEADPRGLYTGSLGLLAPPGARALGSRARFNVAIRTAVVDRDRDTVSYGTGGGIVWDSEAALEYEECRAKARVLRQPAPPFHLFETLLWRPRSGYFLLERHLERMIASARYFELRIERGALEQHLRELAEELEPVRTRVRLEALPDGTVRSQHSAMPCTGPVEWTIVLDDRPTDSSDPFLFHKTTHREIYERALERGRPADEVVLWNEHGQLTEATRANLVLRFGDRWLTPARRCGLLAGTYRDELLARGRLREEVLPVETLAEADEVFLINSLRGWIRARREQRPPAAAPAAFVEARVT